MRYQDQQTDDDPQPAAKSDPVPPPGQDAAYDHDRPRHDEEHDGRSDDERAVDESLVDRGTFDDPVPADGRTNEARLGDDNRVDDNARLDEEARGDETRANDETRTDDDRDSDVAVDSVHDDSGFGQGEVETDRDLADGGATAGRDRTPADADSDLPHTDPDPNRDYSVDRAEAERGDVVEPAPQPTAFGAATVGGAAAAAAMAGRGAEPHDVRDEDTARPGDGSTVGRVADTEAGSADRYPEAGAPDGDLAAEHRRLDGESHPDRPADSADLATADRQTDVPPLAATDAPADGQPMGEVTPAGELMPGDVPAESATTLFAAGAAQGFRERWRDVQLNFVDDPRAAAGDAQRLVEEALDALSAAVAEQKNKLGGWDTGDAGDTENLRMVVRRYRDFLDRVLGL